MPPASIIWTDGKVDDLKRRWDAGETCSQIGRAMQITRSAVIGKVHRLKLTARRVGLNEHDRFIRMEEQKRLRRSRGHVQKTNVNEKFRERKVQEPSIPAATVPFIGSLDIVFADLKPWLSGGANQCRFIAEAGPDYLACGNETLKGESWCGHCRGIVFNRQPVPTLVPEKVAA